METSKNQEMTPEDYLYYITNPNDPVAEGTKEWFFGGFFYGLEPSTLTNGETLANDYLYEFDESILTEGERLNVILPLLYYCAEQGILTDWMKDELWLYYSDYLNEKLKEFVLEVEREEVFKDLKAAYMAAFGTEELVED